jgi:hypothetical protein
MIDYLSPNEKEIILQQYGLSRLALAPSMHDTAEEFNSVVVLIITTPTTTTMIIIRKDRRFDPEENVEVLSGTERISCKRFQIRQSLNNNNNNNNNNNQEEQY